MQDSAYGSYQQLYPTSGLNNKRKVVSSGNGGRGRGRGRGRTPVATRARGSRAQRPATRGRGRANMRQMDVFDEIKDIDTQSSAFVEDDEPSVDEDKLVLAWHYQRDEPQYNILWGANKESVSNNSEGLEVNAQKKSEISKSGMNEKEYVNQYLKTYAKMFPRSGSSSSGTSTVTVGQADGNALLSGSGLQQTEQPTRLSHNYHHIEPDETDTGAIPTFSKPAGGSLYFGRQSTPATHKNPSPSVSSTPIRMSIFPSLSQPAVSAPVVSSVCLIHKPELEWGDIELLAQQPTKPLHPMCNNDDDRKFCMANRDYANVEIRLRDLASKGHRVWQTQNLESQMQSFLTYYQFPTDPVGIELDDQAKKKQERQQEKDVARAMRLQALVSKELASEDDDMDPNNWSVVKEKMDEIRKSQRTVSERLRLEEKQKQEAAQAKTAWPRLDWHCWKFNRQNSPYPELFVITYISPRSPDNVAPSGQQRTTAPTSSAPSTTQHNIYKYIRCRCKDKTTTAQLAMLANSLD